MSIPWDQILLAALLASLLALVVLVLVSFRWKVLTLPQLVGLTLSAGLGLMLWFFIFNVFSLSALDFDFPIPLFPVSPEDLGCLVVTGLVAFIYWSVAGRVPGQAMATNSPAPYRPGGGPVSNTRNFRRLAWWVWVIPALAVLVIDVYFI